MTRDAAYWRPHRAGALTMGILPPETPSAPEAPSDGPSSLALACELVGGGIVMALVWAFAFLA